MNVSIILYLIDFLSHLRGICGFIILLFLIVLAILLFILLCTIDDYNETTHKRAKEHTRYVYKKSWILIIAVLIFVLLPAKTTMYMMIGSEYLSRSNIPVKVQQQSKQNLIV